MVKIATSLILGSAFGFAFAAPRPDSSLGDEVAVSAPNGTPITDTAELASQTAAEASMSMASAAAMYTSAASSMMMGSSSSMMDDSMSTVMDLSTMMGDSMSTMMDVSTMMGDSMSTMMDVSTMMDATSTMMAEATSTMAYQASSSVSVSYGSGSSSWGNSGYNNCVQQCIASFGAPMGTYVPPPPSTVSSSSGSYGGSVGTGATHTIIVAPSQGVLRYVPFATNASVGDTIQFVWHANTHTVTKSSELEICNKTSDSPFTSGTQNNSFVFTQMVNTTDPTFFYCGVPTHCQKGMFGIINPPSALTASTSVSSMMPGLVSNSSDMAAMAMYSQNLTSGNAAASAWGGSIDMSTMPANAYSVVAQNVMYTRTFLAANPSVLQADGTVNMGAVTGNWSVPQDILAVLASSSSASSSPSGSSAPDSGSASSSTTAPSSTPSNGANGLTASMTLSGVIALGAAFLAL